MPKHDQQVQLAIEAWKRKAIPNPPANDHCQRAWLADNAMALRRLIELVATMSGEDDFFKARNLPAPRRDVGDVVDFFAKGECDEDLAEECEPGGRGCKELNDDVGTQGWMSHLIPPLDPCLTERAYQADLACATRRVLEILMPVGAYLDDDGHLVLPRPKALRPTGTES